MLNKKYRIFPRASGQEVERLSLCFSNLHPFSINPFYSNCPQCLKDPERPKPQSGERLALPRNKPPSQ
jgi:hypothetical protein